MKAWTGVLPSPDRALGLRAATASEYAGKQHRHLIELGILSHAEHQQLLPTVRPAKAVLSRPATDQAVRDILGLDISWWQLARKGAPAARFFESAMKNMGAAAPVGIAFWLTVLHGTGITLQLFSELRSIREKRRRLELVSKLLISAIEHGDCLEPATVSRRMALESGGQGLVPLDALEGLYFLWQEVLRDPRVQAAILADGIETKAHQASHELTMIRMGASCPHRMDDDIRRIYSKLISSGIAAVTDVMRQSPSRLEAFDRAHFDQLQEAILEMVSGVVQMVTEGQLKADLGVNFMHYVKRGRPFFEEAKARCNKVSQSVYGQWLGECPGYLLVGPATEPARGFVNFFAPVFEDADGHRLLPGAPATVVRGHVQELYANLPWLREHWPPGLHGGQTDACKDLFDFLTQRGFGYCICIPVFGTLDDGKEIIGVVNVNTRVAPARMTAAMLDRIYDLVKPLLVLLGWTEAVRRVPRKQPSPPARRR